MDGFDRSTVGVLTGFEHACSIRFRLDSYSRSTRRRRTVVGQRSRLTEPLNPASDLRRTGRESPASAPRPASKGREESPPTVRTGDRVQARSRRRLALEQKRDPLSRPMTRSAARRPPGRARGPARERVRTDPQGEGANPRRVRGASRHELGERREPRADGRERMERRTLAGASPCPKVVRTAGNGRARVLSRMPGRNRRGLTPLGRSRT